MWNHENTTALITYYQQHECLYIPNHIHYKNKIKRRAALNNIVQDLKENVDMNVGADNVLKKINGLRTTFMQELNKVTNSRRSGASSQEVYTPTWWCYELLLFLATAKTRCKATSNLSDHNESGPSSQAICDMTYMQLDPAIEEEELLEGNTEAVDLSESLPSPSFSSTPTSQPRIPAKRQKRINEDKEKREFFKESSAALRLIAEKSQSVDHIAAFSQMVDREMRLIKDENKIRLLKREIINLIYDYQE